MIIGAQTTVTIVAILHTSIMILITIYTIMMIIMCIMGDAVFIIAIQ